ncbi:OLC1v1018075C1 [Oldenlandia corymbosa var. corymbosa]|uniref:OLC1v1018075C1 n=1 Tax=Oldenlandia corymbosa var. corymbosa TaxID=529605 RepID=A0AAV1EAZ3_OLDCO|nr:OLC1v1018075C1 [Oldenlandia corymbosa var. corymbosa]
MSAYFSNLTSQQQEALQTQFLLNSKLNTYHQSSDLPENMMYLNSTSLPAAHDCVESQSSESKEEMLFIAPHGNTVMMQPIVHNFAPNYSDSNAVVVDQQDFTRKLLHYQNGDQNLQHQGLSLSLGNQVAEMPSYQNQYSFLSSHHVEHTADDIPQSSELRTAEYFSFDLAGPANNSSKVGAVYGHQSSSIYPKEMTRDLKMHEETVISGAIYNSKYLKAAQELLDEVVNLHQALKPLDKNHDINSTGNVASEETKSKPDELSPAEKNELQNKLTKLLSMLDEVDRKYKQYCQQMQIVVSSFEIVAGCGAGKSYTALARHTISRQFRSLRDAIKSQIQSVQQNLGEEGAANSNQVVGLSRLRYVDQQLRQQRALLQFGVMRQPWRPQRGLPETAVSVLRAWLFEHFLHPYPKDSEKIMLARQTGLSRGQVANWFINARVRLWKPMIEEMYKEEFADMEADSRSSPEHAQATGRLKSESEVTGEEPNEGSRSLGTDYNISNRKVDAYTARLGLQSSSFKEDRMDSDINRSRREDIGSMVDHNNACPGEIIRSNAIDIRASASNAYNFSMLAGTVGNQVSLALGLQHPVKETIRIPGGTQNSSGMEDNAANSSSVGLDKAEYYCLDGLNQQERYSNPQHLLSDFVL